MYLVGSTDRHSTFTDIPGTENTKKGSGELVNNIYWATTLCLGMRSAEEEVFQADLLNQKSQLMGGGNQNMNHKEASKLMDLSKSSPSRDKDGEIQVWIWGMRLLRRLMPEIRFPDAG